MLRENIKKARRAAGLTQQALAQLLGVGQSAVTSWETGRTAPTAARLPALAQVLGCSIDDLYNGHERKE